LKDNFQEISARKNHLATGGFFYVQGGNKITTAYQPETL
jgi:hypothetical protein